MKPALPICVAISLVVAGCTAIPPVGESSVTHEVIVYNNHDNATETISIQIQLQDETVVNSSREMAPGDRWHVTDQDEAGEYTISISTESGQEASESYSLPLAEEGLTSYAVIRITDSGEIDIRIKWQE